MDFKEALETNGVQFIVSLVPNPYGISSRVINREFQTIPDIDTAFIAKQLLDHGIETIYPSEEIKENYNRYLSAFFTDGHPSDTVQDVLADLLERRIRRYYQYLAPPDLTPKLFSEKKVSATVFTLPKNCDIGNLEANSSWPVREILYNNASVLSNPESPFIIVGNSFMRTPSPTAATLPALISLKSKFSVDYLLAFSDGPFTQIPKTILSNPEKYLKHKKVLIFQIGANHLFQYRNQVTSIKQIDNSLLNLTNRNVVFSYKPEHTNEERPSIEEKKFQHLTKPVFFSISPNEEIEIAHISPSCIDKNKSVVCLIPCVAFSDDRIVVKVNQVALTIPSDYYLEPSFTPLSFLLPQNTTDISITASSTANEKVFFAYSTISMNSYLHTMFFSRQAPMDLCFNVP